ncbi:hypothetical protein EVAR_49980_1 [Eumeta japonica]|uniref:Uncharacterized protein n=1 Tax=Eumeta variegata TaxID=151549 RepID=A0A4C1YM74_EUMVA|nr:hypothetical protein EVAR_49980_1 [Eumeta japonica]
MPPTGGEASRKSLSYEQIIRQTCRFSLTIKGELSLVRERHAKAHITCRKPSVYSRRDFGAAAPSRRAGRQTHAGVVYRRFVVISFQEMRLLVYQSLVVVVVG